MYIVRWPDQTVIGPFTGSLSHVSTWCREHFGEYWSRIVTIHAVEPPEEFGKPYPQEENGELRFKVELITPSHELWDQTYVRESKNFYWAVIHTKLTGDDSIWDAPYSTYGHAKTIADKRNAKPPSDYERGLLNKERNK